MVKLVQLLCPSRHALLAAAFEEGDGSFLGACESIELMVGPKGKFKRQCMLCGSFDLHFEEATLPYKTLAEATPALRAGELANLATRKMLDDQGKTLEKFFT